MVIILLYSCRVVLINSLSDQPTLSFSPLFRFQVLKVVWYSGVQGIACSICIAYVHCIAYMDPLALLVLGNQFYCRLVYFTSQLGCMMSQLTFELPFTLMLSMQLPLCIFVLCSIGYFYLWVLFRIARIQVLSALGRPEGRVVGYPSLGYRILWAHKSGRDTYC